jgi:hypothetical protein
MPQGIPTQQNNKKIEKSKDLKRIQVGRKFPHTNDTVF